MILFRHEWSCPYGALKILISCAERFTVMIGHMTEEESENLKQEVAELRNDIHALATIEIYHAAGAVVPAQSSAPLTVGQLNEYNAAIQRINSRYSRQRQG
jgi:hypothetical protein